MYIMPSPGRSVGSDAGCPRVCEFESQLGLHSFRRSTKVIVPCVIRLSPMGCLTLYVKKQPVAWKVCWVVYWCEKTQEMHEKVNWSPWYDWKLLKTTLNPNQSINNAYYANAYINQCIVCTYVNAYNSPGKYFLKASIKNWRLRVVRVDFVRICQ